jgi:dienelactone hydrolase
MHATTRLIAACTVGRRVGACCCGHRVLARKISNWLAYVSRPSGTPKAGLIVFQEAFGVNPHIRDVADRFAREGYLAIAPELFHRTAVAPVTRRLFCRWHAAFPTTAAESPTAHSSPAAVNTALREAKKPHVSVEFSFADHGFFCDAWASYNAEAAAEAWALTLAFLNQHT